MQASMFVNGSKTDQATGPLLGGVLDSTQAVVLVKDGDAFRLLATDKKFGTLGCFASFRLA